MSSLIQAYKVSDMIKGRVYQIMGEHCDKRARIMENGHTMWGLSVYVP